MRTHHVRIHDVPIAAYRHGGAQTLGVQEQQLAML
jgi:hypothetical protein